MLDSLAVTAGGREHMGIRLLALDYPNRPTPVRVIYVCMRVHLIENFGRTTCTLKRTNEIPARAPEIYSARTCARTCREEKDVRAYTQADTNKEPYTHKYMHVSVDMQF